MQPQRFKDKDKNNTIVIIFIILVLIILSVSSLYLYKTYAVFSEEKHFNVINGEVISLRDIYFFIALKINLPRIYQN